MFLDIAANLGTLIYFKYTNFFVASFATATGLDIEALNIILPIGVSFNTFQAMSYIIDVYRGTTSHEKSYYNYLTYTTLFPQIIAGPIVRYVTVENELDDRKLTIANFSKGMRRFIIGLGKKVLIANNVGALWEMIQSGGLSEMSVASYWIGIIAYTFQIYFDFSGYSDMAIGLAEVFGLYFDENFDLPYISKSITEFWRRWHMTLGAWFRDYVYIPLGGNRKGKIMQLRNILIVWALTGFWHGASWNFLFWGLYFGVILIAEKLFLLKLLEKTPKFIQHLYALFLIVIGWVIFYFEDMGRIGGYLKGMFGAESVPLINNAALYNLLSYAIIFVIAILCSTSLLNKLIKIFNDSKKLYLQILGTVFYLLIFIISVAYLVNSTYNPFLYFRF
jgi:alginate O-acetyltransferase complex protein AlgI